MSGRGATYTLQMLGAVRLWGPDGAPIALSSRRSQALLAMLATAEGGSRTRSWLYQRLWSSRQMQQAQASLRRELSNLRPMLNGDGCVLRSDRQTVSLDLSRISTDIAGPLSADKAKEFLDELDIPDEPEFAGWREQQRQSLMKGGHSGAADIRPSLALIVASADHDDANAIGSAAIAIAERLARLRWLALLTAPLIRVPRHSEEKLGEVARTLGPDYLLVCTDVPGSPHSLAITLQEGGGRVIWMTTRELPQDQQPAHLIRIAEEVVAVLDARIGIDQQTRALDRGPVEGLDTKSKVWRARWHMQRFTREDGAEAARLLDEAVRERPHDPDALLQRTVLRAWTALTSRAGKAEIESVRAEAERIKALDPLDARAHQVAGLCAMWLGDHADALPMFEKAVELNPSLSSSYGFIGSCHLLSSDPEKAIPYFERALRLSTLNFEAFHQWGEMALAEFMLGNWAEAIAAADQSLALRDRYIYGRLLKALALDADGKRDQALAEWGRIPDQYRPAMQNLLEWLPFRDRQWNKRLLDGAASLDAGSTDGAR